jgi:hypothetical protein
MSPGATDWGSEPWRAEPIPADTVAAVRAELDRLIEEVVGAVQTESRAYGEVLAAPEGMGIRLGIEQAIRAFLDAVEHGQRPGAETDEIWRRLGEAEFQAGRDLDDLRAAFRTGIRAAWRAAADLATRAGVSAEIAIALAEAIFIYGDELAADVVEGYLRIQSDEAGERERRRRRLAALLLEPGDHDPEVLARAAELARWPMPRDVAAVALDAESPLEVVRRLGVDALSGADSGGAWLLVPDPSGPGRSATLVRALQDGDLAAVGPPVAVAEADRSLRWARAALALPRREALPAPSGAPVAQGRRPPVIRVEDHLPDLLLLADRELGEVLVRSRLQPLESLPAGERERLLQTLGAWFAHQRHTPGIAQELHVHPQTVRYRMARLRELLGGALDTPEGRFELELALRIRAATS